MTDTSFATSCGVPTRIAPPLPTYGPSVPSRTTTKSTSPGFGERARDAGEEAGRAQVDVVVEREAQLQQQPALDVRVREARVARNAPDGPEQDRVVLGDRGEVVIGEHVTGLEEACGAERELRLLEDEVAAGRDRIEHLDGLGDDLRSDSIPGDDGEFDRLRHDTPAVS